MKPAILTFGCAFVLVLASSAHAQPSAEAKAQADALFREARALLSAGKAAEACPKFEKSNELDPQLGTRLNLGVCHAKEGKTATAWGELQGVANAFEQEGDSKRGAYARKQAEALEPKLARVRIRVTDSAIKEIKLDGRPPTVKAAWNTALPIDPGKHTIEASGDLKTSWTSSFTAKEATTIDVDVPLLVDELKDAPPPPPPIVTPSPPPVKEETAPPIETRKPRAPVVGYGLLAVGAIGVGVGTVFGLRTFSLKSDADAVCQGGSCTPEGHALEEDARSASIVSTVGFGVGIVALAAGAYLTFFAKRKSTTSVFVTPTRHGAQAGVQW